MDTFLQIISNVGLHGAKLKFCQSVEVVCEFPRFENSVQENIPIVIYNHVRT